MLDQTTYSLYVLMEISSGDWDSDIKKHLSKKKSYTEKELICILRQLTDALLFMQQKLKISHRDIKPQNVLLFGDGVYKLADFGEAKESKISKEINTLRGTELYMSPALYSGLKNESNDVNHDPYKSDVFSLGFCFIYAAALNFKLLYQLRDVYNSNQMNQILKQQLKKKYSDTFIDILSHMMEVDESLRYDFSHLMEAINANYDEEGNLKNPDSEKKYDSKRGFRKNK
jgi:serine/threonine protein kinase